MTYSVCVFVALGVQHTKLMRGTIVATQKQYCIFWVCVCSLRYPACKAHARYLCFRTKAVLHILSVWM